jgi:hypothetical protein
MRASNIKSGCLLRPKTYHLNNPGGGGGPPPPPPPHTPHFPLLVEKIPKNVYSVEFLRQKVEYLHNNPVAKHWRLADDRADYRYSSARFYDKDEPPTVEVDDVREWM